MDLFNNNPGGAQFSTCQQYRYKLWRIWDESKPLAMCIGLNPSTANQLNDDPTIRTLRKVLNILGYGGFYMTNLFAWISSKPDDLLTCEDPLGDNDHILAEVEKICDQVIVCWGNFNIAEDRINQVLPRFPEALCFGRNGNGSPYHPLALMYKGLTNNPQLVKYIQ